MNIIGLVLYFALMLAYAQQNSAVEVPAKPLEIVEPPQAYSGATNSQKAQEPKVEAATEVHSGATNSQKAQESKVKAATKVHNGATSSSSIRRSFTIAAATKVHNGATSSKKTPTDVELAESKDVVEVEEPVEDDMPFVKVEQMPSFMGGDLMTFRNWVQSKVRFPQIAQENGISGRVLLMFVIERDGSLTNIKVLQSPDSSLSDEAIRVLKTSPKWTPGKQRNLPVRVKYTLPIDFRNQK